MCWPLMAWFRATSSAESGSTRPTDSTCETRKPWPVQLHAPAGLEALSSPEARLVYRLPEPDMHGRHELRLTPLELLVRLARLVPPPRIHRHRYHGVLAPNARLRASVVSMGRPEPDESPVDAEPPPSPGPASH